MIRGVLRVSALLLLLAFASGCVCRKSIRGVGQDHIGIAEPGAVLRDINFAFDSSDLDSLSRSILDENAAWLLENPEARIEIEGHCDERGTNEYNMMLGMRRARSAVEYLRSRGVSADRMTPVSYGEEMPLDPRSNEEAWARNRRGHFKVLD